MRQHNMWGAGIGCSLVVAVGLGVMGCSHNQPMKAEARQAVNQTRGLCPTDLNQAQMIVREGPDEVAVAFRSPDETKIEEISRRAAEIGEALASVHPAINDSGELIQHTPASKPELRELADPGGGRGVELVFRPAPGQKTTLLANLNDHERMWRRGECPIMTDESVKSHETKKWSRVDR
jgi:hypothetical protein